MKASALDPKQRWPDSLYLIGCLGTAGIAPAEYQPSARTMGFKAYNLLRMAGLGLPVPPAFAIGTSYCQDAAARSNAAQPAIWRPGLQALERATGLRFGDARLPLLLSVRSGAPVSMPGMMETLLNIGLHPEMESTLFGALFRRASGDRSCHSGVRDQGARRLTANSLSRRFDRPTPRVARRRALVPTFSRTSVNRPGCASNVAHHLEAEYPAQGASWWLLEAQKGRRGQQVLTC